MAQSLQQHQPIILDVREQQDSESISTAIAALRTQILAGLHKPSLARTLPTLLLYDERGLRLYDDLTTYAPEYYLFGAEEQILTDHARDMVKYMNIGSPGAVVVELGAGSLRKTSHVLVALADASQSQPRDGPPITYYALDLEKRELLRTLNVVEESIGGQLNGKVEARGMWGTYDGGLAFIRNGGLTEGAPDENDDLATETGHLTLKEKNPGHSPIHHPADRSPVLAKRPFSPAPSDHTTSDHPSSDPDTTPSTHTPLTSHESEADKARAETRPGSPLPFEQSATHPPLHFLFLGSSIGNFERQDAIDFLKNLPLRPGSGDTLLLGLDHRNEPEVVQLAYDDPKGYTRQFALNGLRVAERVLQGRGDEVDRDYGEIFAKDVWAYEERYNEREGRHEGYYVSLRDQVLCIPPDIDRPQDPETYVNFKKGELVHFESSYKYSDSEALSLFTSSNLRVVNRWIDNTQRYSVWLLERPSTMFPLLRTPTEKPSAVPTLAEWTSLWSIWDTITLGMIPQSMLLTKPIDLRHKCLFYLGHIPAFLDIHLTRILKKVGRRKELEDHTEPVYFKDIFERGIDPHVDEPSVIHPHSEVPDKDEDWPALEEVLAFRDRVRARLIRVYEEHGIERAGATDPTIRDFPRDIGRVLWMTWEHEAFHAETLLYMLIQKAGEQGGTLPPPGFVPPQWSVLAQQPSYSDAFPSSTITIGPTKLSIGHDDFEADDRKLDLSTRDHEFGWDNEGPKRDVMVPKAVKVSDRPILNGEYYEFWSKAYPKPELPALWVEEQGGVKVRTLYGFVPISTAKNWPFIGSYDELNAFAKSQGGRLPTEFELRHFMDEYMGSDESNIGFKHWHPIPPKASKDGIRGHNGGVWEWTSSLFDEYPGFEKSALYPGYSSDFFDGKHYVVLGGSYATVPRLAQRRTVRNWYQHNYPYAWVGGRVVYDI